MQSDDTSSPQHAILAYVLPSERAGKTWSCYRRIIQESLEQEEFSRQMIMVILLSAGAASTKERMCMSLKGLWKGETEAFPEHCYVSGFGLVRTAVEWEPLHGSWSEIDTVSWLSSGVLFRL